MTAAAASASRSKCSDNIWLSGQISYNILKTAVYPTAVDSDQQITADRPLCLYNLAGDVVRPFLQALSYSPRKSWVSLVFSQAILHIQL